MPEGKKERWSPQGVPYKEIPHIVNADGQYLFCRYWRPQSAPRALILIVHGAGEHCGRYDHLAQRLRGHSLLVFAHDHVGHGQSEGSRMVVSDFHVYIRDCLQHIDHMKKSYPGLPIFILGHSMGGAISILTACEKPNEFLGLVLISPMVVLNPESATPCKVFLAKFLNYLLPNLPLGSIDPNWISRDKEKVESYAKDPLNYHGRLKVSFGIQLMNAVTMIEKALPNITWPFLLLHGDADKLCDIKGSYLMQEKAQSQDKTLKVYEGAYHALHGELPETASIVLHDLESWILQRIPEEQEKD
ncbi:monoglyceride lipase isoform X2 [Latimeria chalumnae]|nr:PREDICTED: monoglyceride lipase isoform X2 [Latimeria chalumnae]XP_005992597.1 PREDICTED: monoglyceride lipase isoform X2 [Latimeria chalumnae]|eukprot:XP_005992596.1 PREDICTED: monoglyceride lipase isoform X2 [Latimeria chalumnae]